MHLQINSDSDSEQYNNNKSDFKNDPIKIIDTSENNEDVLKKKNDLIRQLKSKINKLVSNQCDFNSTESLKKYHSLNLIDLDGNTLKKSNIKCWWCCNYYETFPCFIPEKFQNNKYHVFGSFCSFNCALSYNLNMNDYRVKTRESLIKYIYTNIFGQNSILFPAPKKELLRDFGGILTIAEFRKCFSTIDNIYEINIPPLIPMIHEIICPILSNSTDI